MRLRLDEHFMHVLDSKAIQQWAALGLAPVTSCPIRKAVSSTRGQSHTGQRRLAGTTASFD